MQECNILHRESLIYLTSIQIALEHFTSTVNLNLMVTGLAKNVKKLIWTIYIKTFKAKRI